MSESLRDVLETQGTMRAQQPFLVIGHETFTYGTVNELANRAAAVLVGLGFGPGDVVMACLGNEWAMVVAWFSCVKLGAVFMPVNPLLRGEPLRRVMAHANARVVLCAADLYPAVSDIAEGLPALSHVLITGAADTIGKNIETTLSFDRLLEAASSATPPPLSDDPTAPAKLMYTSGTTGEPKGVIWSRACEAMHGLAYATELVTVKPGEGVYCCLPLSHVTCQGTLLATLHNGGRLTLDAAFQPYRFWDRIRVAEARCFTFVGTILSVLARLDRRPGEADNLVSWAVGAATPVDKWRELEDRFGLSIVETYGQTETASCWTAPTSLPQQPGTVGQENGRFEARVDSSGVGLSGELLVRPLQPNVMFDGYLRPDGSLDRPFDEDGWYHTGDRLVRTSSGDLAFRGRLREAIRRRGEMIAASDVEYAALAYPAVAEAAAVGVPDDDNVEDEVLLCVVAKPNTAVDAAALHRFIRLRLPAFMVPRYIAVRDELPKTPSTRVQKYKLQAAGVTDAWDARRRNRG